MDLLTDVSKLHEQHLHKLDTMVDNIGEEIHMFKVKQDLKTSINHILTPIYSDEQKLRAVVATFEGLIHTAFNQKLAPGVLSHYVLVTIVDHIKEVAFNNGLINFIQQLSDLYKLEISFIHCL